VNRLTSIFLQVRLDSSRLPRKALMKLADLTVVEHAMRALNSVEASNRMLLTTEESESELRPLAEKTGWGVFVGPKEDVLARYILAAREHGAQRLIRATGDNPLVSALMANAALKLSAETGAHYAGFSELPVGSGVEVIEVDALEQAYAEAVDPYEREHVAPFLYRRPERFCIMIPPAPDGFRAPGTRITLDTSDDYDFLQALYTELYRGEPLDLDQVVPYLMKRLANAG
jgi:spore coat polysaccharide biosynthesis protein SpsF